MLKDGMKQVDIAKELKLTKGRVNQIVQKMNKEEIEGARFSPRRSDGKV